MRDIRSIIEELQRHPEFIVADIFTIHDVMEYIQDEIVDVLEDENFELNIDDISEVDKMAMKEYMESMLEQIWRHVDGVYPSFNNLPDLTKKIERAATLEQLLKK